MIVRGTREFIDHFDRAQALTTTPGVGGWTVKDTSSAGTPTYLCITEDGGAMKLTLASTSEAEIVTMYHNDVLAYDLALLQRVWFIVKVAGIDSVTTLTFGLATAQNDTEDSVTVNSWFRMEGSASTSNLLAESDDGTTDYDDKATGTTLSSTYKKCEIDFTNGLSDIRYFVDGARVADSTTFTLASITAGQNVQPFVQLQKASGTGVPSITIAQFGAVFNYAYGA
jgi:hypothetical protein